MYQIRIESVKKPDIYRVIQVSPMMLLYDLDQIIATAFMIEDEDEINLQSVILNGQKNNRYIPLYSDDFYSFEETVGDLFKKVDDEMLYFSESGIELKLTLEQLLEIEGLSNSIIEGRGDLFSKEQAVNIAELNRVLQLEEELEEQLFAEFMGEVHNDSSPDYEALLNVAAELNKMKPWNYFENGDIIAIQLEEMKYFVSVMGAGGQEYGLKMYDEVFGYASLEKILANMPHTDDFSLDISALTINYVNRDELDKEDYQLIKEQGLTFRGKKNWISLRRFEPGFVPTDPDEIDTDDMIEIVKIMIGVTKMSMDGWKYPDVPLNVFPLFEMDDDETIHLVGHIQMDRIEQVPIEIEVNELEIKKIKKKQKSALEIELEYFYLQSVTVNEDEQLIYPLIQVIVDHSTGQVIGNEIIPFPKHSFIQQQLFLEMLKEFPVRPEKILVNEETKRILEPVAKLVGLELVTSALPNIKNLKEMLKMYPQL